MTNPQPTVETNPQPQVEIEDQPQVEGHNGCLWLTRWYDHATSEHLELVVHATTIEEARLAARLHAGPTTAVAARLATNTEAGEEAS